MAAAAQLVMTLPVSVTSAIFVDPNPHTLCGIELGPAPPVLPSWLDEHHEGLETRWGWLTIGEGGIKRLFRELDFHGDEIWRIGVLLELDGDDADRALFDELTELCSKRFHTPVERRKWTSRWVAGDRDLELRTARRGSYGDTYCIELALTKVEIEDEE